MSLEWFIAREALYMERAENDSATHVELPPMEHPAWDPRAWHLSGQARRTESTAAGPHGDVPLRLFTPKTQRRTPPPALLWVHGGGFRNGDLDMLESQMVASEIATRTQTSVISVDYRLARHGVRYPVPVDDVRAAWDAVSTTEFWERSNLAPPTKVFLGGASAGAALAVATAMRLRDEASRMPAGLLLAYPFLHFPNPAVSPELAAQLSKLPRWFRITPAKVEEMVRNYTGALSAVPAYAMPGNAAVTGLPPTAILISELDDLSSSGELFCRQLQEAGIHTELFTAVHMPHGHLNWPPAIPGVDASLDFLSRFIR